MLVFRTAPAVLWRAFFLAASLATTVFAAPGPAKTPPPLQQFGAANSAEARAALEQMRRQGIAGDYYLEFQLRVMPRRGDERLIAGRMWGGRNEIGPLTRVSLAAAADGADRRLLIQNGPRSSVWRWDPAKGVEMLGVSALFEPLVAGTEITAFDLQMPFIYWENFSYEGLARVRGRPAHVLVMKPPAEFAAKHPTLTGVRVNVDTQFNALMQTELLGSGGVVVKTLSVVDLKKVGEQWIVKTVDVRDEATHNKTRFSVVAAALDLDFAGGLFAPAQLADEARPPTAGLVKLGP